MIAAIAANTAIGEKYIIYCVIFKMTCATASKKSTMIVPFSPMAAVAMPKKIENTTTCKISFLAMASITLLGKT